MPDPVHTFRAPRPESPHRQEWGHHIAVGASVLLVVSAWLHVVDLSVPGMTDRSGRLKGGDYATFYAAGRLALERRWDDAYSAEAQHAMMRTTISPALHPAPPPLSYSPIVALGLAPFAVLPFLASYAVFSLFSATAYTAGTLVLLHCSHRIRAWWVAAALSAAAMPAFGFTLRSGQLASFWWLALCIAIARTRGAPGGGAIGFLWLKPTLAAIPTAMMVWCRAWGVVLGMAAMVAAHVLLAVMVAGTGATYAYLAELGRLARRPELIEPFPASAHSISGFIRLAWPMGPVTGITVAVAALCLWATLSVWRNTTDARLRWSATVICMLLVSPHVMTYDLLLAGIPLILIIDWMLESGPSPLRPGLVVLLLAVYFAPFSPLVAEVTRVQLSTLVLISLLLMLRLTSRRHGRAD